VRIIAGRWKGRRLAALKGRGVRPTTDRVREAWMSALGGTLEGRTVVDLFAGSGALGLEALSRGCSHAVFVERSRGSLRVLEANITLLEAESECTVVAQDVFRYLGRLEPHAFDLALADPPYGKGHARRLVEAFQDLPFARELWVEHAWRDELPTPEGASTRRYGDTALTTLPTDP